MQNLTKEDFRKLGTGQIEVSKETKEVLKSSGTNSKKALFEETLQIEEKNTYITVVNGLGERHQILKSRLEKYKQQMAEFRQIAEQAGGIVELYDIKEILEK